MAFKMQCQSAIANCNVWNSPSQWEFSFVNKFITKQLIFKRMLWFFYVIEVSCDEIFCWKVSEDCKMCMLNESAETIFQNDVMMIIMSANEVTWMVMGEKMKWKWFDLVVRVHA